MRELLRSSSFFGIMIDECVDIAVREMLIIVIRFIGPDFRPHEIFLNIQHVADGKGKTLFEKVKSTLKSWDLPLQLVVACCTDGAGAMLGAKSGFHALLKRENPYAISIHCSAHRGGLSLRDVLQCHRYLVYTFNDTFRQLYDYFDNSAKRTSELAATQASLGMEENLKVKEPCTTRWSYMRNAVDRVMLILPSLITNLKRYCESVREKPGLEFQFLLNLFVLLSSSFNCCHCLSVHMMLLVKAYFGLCLPFFLSPHSISLPICFLFLIR